MRLLRSVGKAALGMLALAAIVLAAWFGINATDETLSDDARAALALPPLPAPDRDNGYLDLLTLAAPAELPAFEAGLDRLKALNNPSAGSADAPWPYSFKADPRLRRCTFGGADGGTDEARACFELATREPWIQEALDAQATLVKRYRAMREKPRFASLLEIRSPEQPLPAFQELLEGDRLVLLAVARRFHAGERRDAVRELEREAAFYRRMARDANMLIDKMIAYAALDRVALFTAELARRAPPSDAAFWRALESTVLPLTREELDLAPVFARELGNSLQWLTTRNHVRLSDLTWEALESYRGMKRPWWEPVAPYLYRPHQTANWYLARCRIFLAVGERPSTEFFKAREEAQERARALDPGPVARVVFNPAGWRHPLLEGCDNADYVGRSHGRAGVQTLARLVVNLHAKGITKPEDIAAALAGQIGQAHPDPFTGKPMRYDPSTRTLGFEIDWNHVSGVARFLHRRYGRMAVPL